MTGTVRKFSAAGTYHISNNIENQDALSFWDGGRYCAAVLADGVSSCSRAAEGAGFIANAMTEWLKNNCGSLFLQRPDRIAEAAADEIQARLGEYSRSIMCGAEELSSTLSFVLADRESPRAVCLSLGDGLIISASSRQCRVEIQPDIIIGGCFTTTTEGFEKVIRCRVIAAEDIHSIAVCSDGAWKAMYDKTRLREDIRTAFMKNDTEHIFDVLQKSNSFDDLSIIFTELHPLFGDTEKL